MKTKIYSFLLAGALLTAPCIQAHAVGDSIVNTPEQRIEKASKDIAASTLERVSDAMKEGQKKTENVKDYVARRLDDTIINGKELRQRSERDTYIERYNNNLEHENALFDKSFNLAKSILKGISFTVLGIILLIILGIYFNRRQKYKIMEKAIENNYPLPPGFLGKNMRPTSTTIQHIHYTSDQAKPTGKSKVVKEFNVSDWANFRSGIKWCAWGVAFMLFFLINDAPVWVFAIIPIVIGAGKLYVAHKLQKAEENAKVYTEKDDTPTPPPFPADDDTK